MSKTHLLEGMLSANKIPNGDKDLLRFTKFPIGITHMLNMQITKHGNGGITCTSLGGPLFNRPIADMFISVKNMHDLPKDDVNKVQSPLKAKKHFGLKDDETSLLCTLPSSILEDLEENSSDDDELDDDQLPGLNTHTTHSKLSKLLSSDNFNLLEEILEELQELDFNKWSNWTLDDLFPDLLRNTQKLMSTCIVKDLNVIGKVLHNYTGHFYFSNNFNKAKNCNLISEAFEGTNFVDEIHRSDKKQSNVKNPRSLHEICRVEILKDTYPSTALKVCYACVLHMFKKGEYLSRCNINLTAVIPWKIAGKNPTTMKMFCYPEFSTKRAQLGPHTLDYLHILTNMQTHICNKGYDYCPNEHFVELCESHPDILSKAVVVDHIDAQNVFTAIHFFGIPVEQFMVSKGYMKTVEFIRLVRNWFRACDE